MKIILFSLSFFIALLLETTIIQLPFTLLLLIVMTIMYQNEWMFLLAVLLGFFLDGLLFRPLGGTSLFFLLVVLFVFLYERKFELRTVQFVILMSFLGSFVYFLLFGHVILWLQIVLSILFGSVCFFAVKQFGYRQVEKNSLHVA